MNDPIVAAARRGDPDAFAALYDAHAGRVHALCLRLVGDRAIAGELVQDVFVRVWEQLGSFRGESAFGTWLHRVATNVVWHHLRGGARRRQRVAWHGELDGDPPDAAARGGDPAVRLDLERAIAGLPAQARTVFVLHDVEGLSHDEIAARLGIAAGTARAHLFRARRQLREVLQ